MASADSHSPDGYAERLAHLHTDRNRRRWTAATDHRAPHKMLLLLAVMDLIERGDCTDGFVTLSPRLLGSFAGYWSAIMPRGTRGDICKPFFHLRYERFWELVPRPGQEQTLQALTTCHSMRQLNSVVLGARLDDALHAFMCDPTSADTLRRVLVETYCRNAWSSRGKPRRAASGASNWPTARRAASTSSTEGFSPTCSHQYVFCRYFALARVGYAFTCTRPAAGAWFRILDDHCCSLSVCLART